ncbi:MAG: lytic transglycosylase domain-containing protein [Bacteroidetes bacterium]|nr:lytic transglycosylase domain-containing protein [Bacteroidota bacterium]
MLTSNSIRNILFTIVLLLIVVPAVDGSNANNYFDGIERVPFNKHVKKFVRNYIQQNNQNLYIIKKRSHFPFTIIDSVLTQNDLPTQLKYLAVVESELKAKAVSNVGAVGLWQLMPETARILGLKITRHTDERTNDYKSTRAAALHLKYLHEEFGDWLLAFAAYNCGEGPVYDAIRQSGSRNFWILQSYLPSETKEYVKKFIATCYYFEGSRSLTMLSASKKISAKNS